MPLAAFLRLVADKAGVSVVAAAGLDGQPVTVEVSDVSANEVLGVVARRLGVQATRSGRVFFLGDLRPEDRGVMVRKVGRLSSEQLQEAVTTALSDFGRVAVFEDGTFVAADRVEVLERVNEILDGVEAVQPQTWVVQFYVLAISERDSKSIGLDGDAAIKAGAAFASVSGSAIGTASISASLDALLRLVDRSEHSKVISRPLLLLSDGKRGVVKDGRRIPLAKRTVSDAGTVTVSDFDFIDTGFNLSAAIRESGAGARLKLELSLSDVVGAVEDAPITVQSVVEAEADVEAGGVYLLSSVERQGKAAGRDLGLRLGAESDRTTATLQVWARIYRITGAAMTTTHPTTGNASTRASGGIGRDRAGESVNDSQISANVDRDEKNPEQRPTARPIPSDFSDKPVSGILNPFGTRIGGHNGE